MWGSYGTKDSAEREKAPESGKYNYGGLTNDKEEWETESPAECKARLEWYAEIVVEKAPKSLSPQEQAKAIADSLENIENGIEFLEYFRRRFDKDYSDSVSASDTDSGSAREYVDCTSVSWSGQMLTSSTRASNSQDINTNTIPQDSISGLQGVLCQQQEILERGCKRQRHKRRKEKCFHTDLRRYDTTIEDIRRARKILDDRMLAIDIAHQHSWDVARRYVEKEKPVRNKNLHKAIAEAKKDEEAKKDKAEKEKRRYSRRRSRSPRDRRRDRSEPRSGYSCYSCNRNYYKDKAGCFTCGSTGHRARDCLDKRSK